MTTARRQEAVSKQEGKRDCGCGCGGALCGPGRKEMVWVGTSTLSGSAQARENAACTCGRECC